MHRSVFAAVAAIALSGCAHDIFVRDPGITTYYDRNHDGRVDFEFHDLGGGDMDWAFNDRDFDGFYDLRLRYGIVMGTDQIHLPVVKGVKITKGRLPVVITEPRSNQAMQPTAGRRTALQTMTSTLPLQFKLALASGR